MESVQQIKGTWLDKLSIKFKYEPKYVGSGYQPLATSWSTHRSHSFVSSRRLHGYVTYYKDNHHQFLVAGGCCKTTGSFLNDVLAFLPETAEVETVTQSARWSPRHSFALLSTPDGSRICVIGGEDPLIKSDVWLSTDQGQSFTCKCLSAPWEGRVDFAATFADDIIVIAGGRTPTSAGLGKLLSDVWTSNDNGRSWEQAVEKAAWKPRANASLLYSGGNLILLGGVTDISVSDEIWTSANMGKNWARVSMQSPPWAARRACSTVVDRLSGEILIFGGFNGDGAQLTDSWATIDSGRSWLPRKAVPNLECSSPVNAVSDGGKVLLMNSSGGVESLSDLQYVKRDCRIVLLLGSRIESHVSRDLLVTLVIPYAIDTRALGLRTEVPWALI